MLIYIKREPRRACVVCGVGVYKNLGTIVCRGEILARRKEQEEESREKEETIQERRDKNSETGDEVVVVVAVPPPNHSLGKCVGKGRRARRATPKDS